MSDTDSQWKCAKCTNMNLNKFKICEECMYPKILNKKTSDEFVDKRLEELTRVHSMPEPIKHPEFGAVDEIFWRCESCTFTNEGVRNKCDVCKNPREQVSSTIIEDEDLSWICERCTFINKGLFDKCKSCKNSQEHNQEAVADEIFWICKQCTYTNEGQTDNCEICNDLREGVIKKKDSSEPRDPIPSFTDQLIGEPTNHFNGRSTKTILDHLHGAEKLSTKLTELKEKHIKNKDKKERDIEKDKWDRTFPLDKNKVKLPVEEVVKEVVKESVIEEIVEESVIEELVEEVKLSEANKMLRDLALERAKRRKN